MPEAGRMPVMQSLPQDAATLDCEPLLSKRPSLLKCHEGNLTFFLVVVHFPRAGLVMSSLYSRTFKSLCAVRLVMPNSSTTFSVVTIPLSRIYKYTSLMRVSIRPVAGFNCGTTPSSSFSKNDGHETIECDLC
jgi:hypothetical protein